MLEKELKLHHPKKFEYDNTTIKNGASLFNDSLCAYCAGSPGANGIVDDILCVEWKSVLHVCTSCHAAGAILMTRTRRRNGAANGARSKRARRPNPSPQAIAPNASFAPLAHALAPTRTPPIASSLREA